MTKTWIALVALGHMLACEWGPALFDCGDVDEVAAQEMAERRGVLAAWNRMDVFCEPREGIAIDCQNHTAEVCTVFIGSAVHRGRVFASDESTEGVLTLLEHEMAAHWGGEVDPDDKCAGHPPVCDGLP